MQIGVHLSGSLHNPEAVIDGLRERIEDLKGEVEFYRDELRDRRQTTAALTDVIEAFRLALQSGCGFLIAKIAVYLFHWISPLRG